MFPDDDTAEAWFASVRWPDGPECPHCGHDNIQHPTTHPKMAYRCRRGGCRKFFSVRTGTVMAHSKISFQKWAIAVFLMNVNIKGTSSLRLHRDLGISQKSAWFMAHRVREAWAVETAEPMRGPVEADETYIGGLAKNMHARVRREKITGRGAVDKTAVVGARDRSTGQVAARVVGDTTGPTLRGFVAEHAKAGAQVYTDEAKAYRGLPRHRAVCHFGRPVRRRHGARQRDRVVLGWTQARLPRDAPQHEREAPTPLRGGVFRAPQRSPAGHEGDDAAHRSGHSRQAPHLCGPHRGAQSRRYACGSCW